MSFRKIEKPTGEMLNLLYVVLQLSTVDIAAQLGVDDATVGRWLRSYDIPLRPRSAFAKPAIDKISQKSRNAWTWFRKNHQSEQRLGKPSPAQGKHWTVGRLIERPKARGAHNPQWKGGKTKLIFSIRACGHYSIWRKRVYERDKYTCVLCDARSVAGNKVEMEADHIKRLSDLIDEYQIQNLAQAIDCTALWDVNNGRTLCQKCHKQTNTYGRNRILK